MSPALWGCKGRVGGVRRGWLCLYNLSGGFQVLCQGLAVYSWTLQFISAKLSDQFLSDCQWRSCWKEHGTITVSQALASPTGTCQ